MTGSKIIRRELEMTDEKAIKLISSGDEKAIAWVMDRYSRMLWRAASSILSSKESDIEECVADVFISLWQKPEQYDAKRGKLSTWLCTMVKSRALDRLRSINARIEDPTDQLPETADISQDTESSYDMDRYLDQLSDEDREIVKRRYYEEQKPAEIAADMGLDKKKVENRLFRSKRKLKDMLGGRGREFKREVSL